MINQNQNSSKFNSHQFKKSLGQNFISDKNLLQAIAQDAEINKKDYCVEVGAGAGTLTEVLAENAFKVISFEVDESLKDTLSRVQSQHDNLKVVFKDILKVEKEELQSLYNTESSSLPKLKVIANIPYYITTPIIFKFLDWCDIIDSITIMVQKEVGARITAQVGDADYGSLSAVIGHFGCAILKRIVKKQNFYPMPKVDSCIVQIKINKNLDIQFSKKYCQVVQKCFISRRKTIVNNLMLGYNLKRADVENYLNEINISNLARAEEFNVEKFEHLTQKLIDESII